VSNKSGTSSQVISLPTGGGALKGLGEKFSPDLHTGTGNYAIALSLPPGRNGFQPQLSLNYSTGQGNSAFGLGWNISIPEVSRKTSKGVPQYEDTKDTFVLSGAEDLVAIAQSPTVTQYRPRTEGLFARIEHHRDASNNFWKVWNKDGLVSVYGTPRPTNAASDWQDPAVIADPTNRQQIFSWKLSQTIDPFGNRIEYEYERDANQTNSHPWDMVYLKCIRYVDYVEDNQTKFLVSVRLEYGDRADTFSDLRSGFEIRTRKRCEKISIHTHAGTDILTRTYDLVYLDQRPDKATLLPLNRASLLSQVIQIGHDGDRTEAYPPLEFSYTRFEPQKRQFFAVQGNLPAQSLAHPNLELADITGNGLPDILEMSGIVRYWRNLGNGKFAAPREMKTAPSGFQLADAGVQLLDTNGDGRIDLLVTKGNQAGYYPMRSGRWDERSFQSYPFIPSFNLEDPEVKLLDLDGDGVIDALRSGTQIECFFNHPEKGWHRQRRVERRSLADFPNVNFSDPRVKWGDMTGDGLQDIVLIHDGRVEYWANRGYGNWSQRIVMQNSPRFRYGYDPRRILIGDVDSDGLADLVYVDDCMVVLWINQGGRGWSEPIEIKGTPAVSNIDAVRLVDLLGTGVSGILWSADAATGHRMFFLDFTGGTKPYLLNEMNNHMGAMTRVYYAPSTEFYLADEQTPQTCWQTSLPFPVQVVKQTEAIDLISKGKLTTHYSYHHGYWDGLEREFRGFGRVEQTDAEVFDSSTAANGQPSEWTQYFSPPMLTRTWFHQGAVEDDLGDWKAANYEQEYWSKDGTLLDNSTLSNTLKSLSPQAKRDALRSLRSRMLRTEVYALDGSQYQDKPYTVSEFAYGVVTVGGHDRIFFPHALAERTTQWERGDDPMTQFAFTGDYDDYGQPQQQIKIACPRGWKNLVTRSSRYFSTQTITQFAQQNTQDRYIADRAVQTTTYEVIDSRELTLTELQAAIVNQTATFKLISQTLNYYDGNAFEGLPLNQLGNYGALVRTETLALTEDILQQAYGEIPPWFDENNPDWTAYPQEWRDRLPNLAGYIHRAGIGYFVATQQRQYDFQHNGYSRGLIVASRDSLGKETQITYDEYQLLPIEVTNAVGLTNRVIYNYRVLQPGESIDYNGNRTLYTFTPLGLLQSTAILGKTDEGDTSATPSQQRDYDWLAFVDRNQPISVRTQQRVHHAHETDVPGDDPDATIMTIEYSDGFGRLLQTRTQAEDTTFDTVGLSIDISQTAENAVGQTRLPDDPVNVIVSGWQVYNNKGQVVATYEPFFATGWKYMPPNELQLGQKTLLFYDPRGQVIRTINADGSEKRTIFGMPEDLSNSDSFLPTPWETYIYDTNDNAGRTHPEQALAYQTHWNTPVSTILDALGRTIVTVERLGTNPETEWYTTRSTYDIRGNLLTIQDALGRVAFRYTYNLSNQLLRVESLDRGINQTMFDAMGNPLVQRDSKGALILRSYDALGRPLQIWARDNAQSPLLLREQLEYGDTSFDEEVRSLHRAKNRLGKLYQHFDEAGLLTIGAYDFKGNVLEKVRQVVSDEAILQRVQTSSPIPHPLDPTEYRTSFTYDALNRIKTMHYPQDVEGQRRRLRPQYNRAGLLERVELEGTVYVDRIAYNARRQRILIAYGNGVMTRYAYHPQSSKLVRMRSDRYQQPDVLTYTSSVSLQDLAYTYDLVGNVLSIQDRTSESGVVNNPQAAQVTDANLARLLAEGNALIRQFAYDPLYRLQSATGRESDPFDTDAPWDETHRSQDFTRTRLYTERYDYDAAGNLLQLQHSWQGTRWQRQFSLDGSNRLSTVQRGQTVHQYEYDASGNLIQENQSRHFEWDWSDRLCHYRTQAGDGTPSIEAYYLYGSSGQRVKKLVRKGATDYETTTYIDGAFEYHRQIKPSGIQENNTLHVMDNHKRIALVRIGQAFSDDGAPDIAVKYHLSDHLGSSSLVISGEGTWMNREEYTPYGQTSFGSFARKRYRFTGKERDEESGLAYHGARYYAAWLARWMSCDPAPLKPGSQFLNRYSYVLNNPLAYNDPDGREEKPPDTTNAGNQEPSKLPPWLNREQLNEVRLHTAKRLAAEGKDVVTGRPYQPPEVPLTWDEKIAFAIEPWARLILETALTGPIAEGVFLKGAATMSRANRGRTALTFAEIKPVNSAVEAMFQPTPSPKLARTLESLQAEGVKLRGNFVHVEPGTFRWRDIENHGGAFHHLKNSDKGTTFVNMDLLGDGIKDPSTGAVLNTRQVLQHEMGHFGQATLPDYASDSLNYAAYYNREAQASMNAAKNATNPEDKAALLEHASKAINQAKRFLGW
jgi:RHS repeat-associated protein